MNNSQPWERQQGESEKAFEAFAIYRDLGADRSLQKVTQELNKSRTIIARWSRTYHWRDRAREYDNDLERQAKKKAEKGLRDMCERHTKIAVELQTKALQALKSLNPDDMSIKDIREYIRMATDLERLNRTMTAEQHGSTEQSAQSLADTIVAAYERRKGGDDD